MLGRASSLKWLPQPREKALVSWKSLKHPGVYQSIITSSTNLGLVSKGSVVWKDTSYWRFCFFCTTRKIYIKDIEIRSIQASNTRVWYNNVSHICNPSVTPRTSGEVTSLNAC
ncbi:hypothetical protein GQR58_018613 [Nymphon striatum]|nr:hypothetical protein GQR58_018613 [Nymphon striatum]